MKQILSCFFLLLLTTQCFTQRVSFNKGGISVKNYYREIPYELINGRIYLRPSVNGIKRKFLFDTGAPAQITAELFGELQPEVINHTKITDAAGNKNDLRIVSLKNIELDSLIFNDIPALVTESDLYKCLSIDGVIGSNLLRNSVVQILPARHLLILTDDEKKLTINHKNQTALITGEPQSYPFFLVQLPNENTLKVGFDTGTDNFLRLSEKEAERLQKSNTYIKLSAGYGASSRSLLGLQAADSLYRLQMSPLQVAGSTFHNVITETSKSNNSRIGARLLDYGTVTLDFIHHIFYFDPFKESNDMNEMHWPLKPVIDQDSLVVGVVWKSLQGKIQSGDRILAIDNESCEAIRLCDWLNGKSQTVMQHTYATLKIRNKKGDIQEIRINKE